MLTKPPFLAENELLVCEASDGNECQSCVVRGPMPDFETAWSRVTYDDVDQITAVYRAMRSGVMPCQIDITNYVDADGEAVQTYFAAFMIEHGYDRAKHIFARDGSGFEFMRWNQRKWAEFEIANGYPVGHHTRNLRAAEFTKWLSGRATDILARRAVETA